MGFFCNANDEDEDDVDDDDVDDADDDEQLSWHDDDDIKFNAHSTCYATRAYCGQA